MAVLRILEVTATMGDYNLAMLSTAMVSQTLTIGTTSARSSAFDNNAIGVRMLADTNCYVLAGRTTTFAATTDAPLPLAANVPEYFGIPLGAASTGGFRIAVITT